MKQHSFQIGDLVTERTVIDGVRFSVTGRLAEIVPVNSPGACDGVLKDIVKHKTLKNGACDVQPGFKNALGDKEVWHVNLESCERAA